MLILHPGDSFAGYQVLSLCGSGGMGAVYLALDTLQRKVALKIVPVADCDRELEGIRRYIRISSEHPDLLQIYHAGIEQNCLYYTMKPADPLENTGGVYVPKTLSALLERTGKMRPSDALDMVRKLACGLEKLHGAGLIHRDIKPDNIIFSDGIPKLCDPGLVCAAESTVSFVGTLGYLPPECFNGDHLNEPQRDIYALGKVLYVAVTGESAARYPYLPPDMPFTLRRKLWPLLIRVCYTNPKHRFKTVSDFLRAMPAELPNPGRLDILQNSFRQWRLVHPFFTPSVLLAAFLLLAAGGAWYAVHLNRLHREAEIMKKSLDECGRLEARFRKRAAMLFDQLDAADETSLSGELRAVLDGPPPDIGLRLRTYRSLDERLRKTSLRLLQPVPRDISDPKEVLRISDVNRGLLASPLGDWLTNGERSEAENALRKLERQVFPAEIKLRPGQAFRPDTSYFQKFVYVPAGSFRNKDGKLVHVPQAFWCSDSELRGNLFGLYAPVNDFAARPDMPMSRMIWNDLLEFCHIRTLEYRERKLIPNGFIIRPLRTSEWQWACRGAWSGIGNATAFLKDNSGGIIHPVRFGDPNNLGLYDMIGNVAEITIPEPENRQSHCADICGGWHGSKKADPETRIPYLKYQFFPPYVGSRIVVARGDMDFFERELWTTESRQMEFQGKRYELLVSNRTMMSREAAEKLCGLLGGHMAVPDSPELLKAWRKVFWETNTFSPLIGGTLKDGAWIRPDGKPYTGIPMPPVPNFFPWILVFCKGRVQVMPADLSEGVICQWTEEEYRNRTNLERIRKSPGILHSFQFGNKLYILFSCRAHNHTARQIAGLLGGRLAEPRNEEIRERFRQELAPWRARSIMLGGVWKYGRWVFQDGTRLNLPLDLKGQPLLNSMNAAAPSLKNGEYCALQDGQAFLLEFPLE